MSPLSGCGRAGSAHLDPSFDTRAALPAQFYYQLPDFCALWSFPASAERKLMPGGCRQSSEQVEVVVCTRLSAFFSWWLVMLGKGRVFNKYRCHLAACKYEGDFRDHRSRVSEESCCGGKSSWGDGPAKLFLCCPRHPSMAHASCCADSLARRNRAEQTSRLMDLSSFAVLFGSPEWLT